MDVRRRLVERKNRSYANSFTTFFFSNFPDSHGEYEMLVFFQKWARVKEVFISRRRNRWGKRFGFVRFFGVGNSFSLEKELDRCYVGNMKLYVNLPRYRRDEYAGQGGGPRMSEDNKRKGVAHQHTHRKNKEVWKEKVGKEDHRNGTGVQSYADAVKR